MSSQEIPQGYKQTKVGVIPEEWEVVKFEDIFYEIKEKIGEKDIETYSISAGKGFVSQKNRFGKDISGNQNKNYILLKENQFAYNKGNSKSYQYGCIYPNITGKSISVPNVFISFDFLDKKMSMAYYAKLFEHHFLDRGLRRIISSSARMDGLLNINKKYFFELPIIKPPLKEQQKIAQILTTWDRAIEKLEALIEEEERLKKGLMQKLLSGEVRFEGFDEEWEEVRLGDVGKAMRGVSYKPNDLSISDTNKTIRLMRSNNIKSGYLDRNTELQYVNNTKVKEVQYLTKGDLAICMANGSKNLVGKNGEYIPIDDYTYTVGAFCAIFRFNKDAISKFFKYIFQSEKYNYYVQNLLAGSNINNLKGDDIEMMKFEVPISKQEQQKIAQVLTTVDREIGLLKEELDALKEQKRGLKQRLLTGEVRVRV